MTTLYRALRALWRSVVGRTRHYELIGTNEADLFMLMRREKK